MPCEPFSIRNGKVTGWMCRRSREKPKPPICYKCGKPATKFCDFRDLEVRHGRDEYDQTFTIECPSINTCDRPMCDECANHYGDDTDFCDEHNNELARKRTVEAERAFQNQLKRMETDEADDGENN